MELRKMLNICMRFWTHLEFIQKIFLKLKNKKKAPIKIIMYSMKSTMIARKI
jgi:hypothetical protein